MRAALLLLLITRAAFAQTGPLIVKQDGITVGAASVLDFASGSFTCSSTTGGVVCSFNSGFGVGTAIGDACADWAATVDMCTSIIDAHSAVWILPQGTSAAPTGEGRIYWQTATDTLTVGDGTNAAALRNSYARLGGDGSDGAFTFDGSCSAGPSCCTQGTISGSAPNKVCALTANSPIGRYLGDAGTTLYSCLYNFSDFTLSGGTVTCNQAGAIGNVTQPPSFSTALVARINGALSLTGGTIDMSGKGGHASAGGASGTAAARAGGAGCNSNLFLAPAVAAAGNTTGTAGFSVPNPFRTFPVHETFYGGEGGGGGAGAGAAGGGCGTPQPTGFGFFGEISAATGGGGGGCAATASTSAAGGNGGRGGGYLRVEYAGTWATSAGVILTTAGVAGVAGVTGGAGGGGGGGGNIDIIARAFGTDSGTYTVAGGSAGAVGTNCAAGAAGGNGKKTAFTVPQ